MNIIEKLDMPIYKKENKFKKIDKDKNFNQKNLYIGENDKNELYFLILVNIIDVNEEKILKMKQIIISNKDKFINLKFIVVNDEKSVYFAYQYYDFTFLQFVNRKLCSTNFKTKLILAKQLIEIIDFTNNNNLVISDYDPNMFSVCEIDSSLILKYFYNGNFLEDNSSSKDKMKNSVSQDFLIVFKFFIQLFKENSSRQNNINEVLNDVTNKDISNLLNIFLNNSLMNPYSFNYFIKEFNKLLKTNDILIINHQENRNENKNNNMYMRFLGPPINNYNFNNNFNNTLINMNHFVFNEPLQRPPPYSINCNMPCHNQPFEMFCEFFKSMYNNNLYDHYTKGNINNFGLFPNNFAQQPIIPLTNFDFNDNVNNKPKVSSLINLLNNNNFIPNPKYYTTNNIYNSNANDEKLLNQATYINKCPEYLKPGVNDYRNNKNIEIFKEEPFKNKMNSSQLNNSSQVQNNNFLPHSNKISHKVKKVFVNNNDTQTSNSDEDFNEKLTKKKRQKRRLSKIPKKFTKKQDKCSPLKREDKNIIKIERNHLHDLEVKAHYNNEEKDIVPNKIKIEKDFNLVISINKDKSGTMNENNTIKNTIFEVLSDKKIKKYALSEEDKKMISMVEFPRRFKNKKQKKNEEGEAFLENKNCMIKAECLKLKPILEKEIEELTKHKLHFFMKENFPNMYNLENYYTHIRLINERREEKKHLIYAKLEENFLFLGKESDSKIDSKLLWKNESIVTEKEINEFIKKIEKVWPNDESFTQEGILGILMESDYNFEKVINLMSNKDTYTINLIKEINLKNKMELEKLSSLKTKNYTLRNNK